MDFLGYLQHCQQRIEQILLRVLPAINQEPQRLHQAMHYAILNGGKRLRPLLVYACGELVNADSAVLDKAACAVEFIHTYSLIHDDLPAMDNDTLRRGKPTCHIAFDEATAILAGDALQSLAFQMLAQSNAHNLPAMIYSLAQASGSLGMVGGQALDLAAVNTNIDLNYLTKMHTLKTGALISASIQLSILASATELTANCKQDLQQYAEYLGLAFQIQDDILDVEGDTALTGKQQGKDSSHNKPNFPSMMGLAQAKNHLQILYEQALTCLLDFGEKANRLREIAAFIIQRNC